MSDDFTTLSGTLDAVWRRLDAGVSDPAAPARHPVLATQARAGGGAARIVVLRAAEREPGRLVFWTHAASGKVAETAANPRAELLIWDAPARFQIRLAVILSARPATPAEWAALGPGATLNYARDPMPGDPLDDPATPAPTPDPALFTVLDASITRIETLHLGQTLHRRARFSARNADWIAP